ncbi:MAG: hypothetical protein LBK44_06105 [Spirochaetales bacterium]|jgi:hypothetical protein|nr:hypothetical protein [Spirochaetales bacterium]
MMQFIDLYDDIDFMIALFFNGMLNNADIYEIANRLNNKTSDDVLVKIIANGANCNNERLFDNYLNALGIKLFDSKRAIVAKVFYYILHNRLDLGKGIRFLDLKVLDYENTTEYLGDDVGIERIIGNFYASCDAIDKKKKETLKKAVLEEMRQYVNDNLVEFSVGNI